MGCSTCWFLDVFFFLPGKEEGHWKSGRWKSILSGGWGYLHKFSSRPLTLLEFGRLLGFGESEKSAKTPTGSGPRWHLFDPKAYFEETIALPRPPKECFFCFWVVGLMYQKISRKHSFGGPGSHHLIGAGPLRSQQDSTSCDRGPTPCPHPSARFFAQLWWNEGGRVQNYYMLVSFGIFSNLYLYISSYIYGCVACIQASRYMNVYTAGVLAVGPATGALHQKSRLTETASSSQQGNSSCIATNRLSDNRAKLVDISFQRFCCVFHNKLTPLPTGFSKARLYFSGDF